MRNIKNIVWPGWVQSKYDGDWHFITGPQLVKLYGLKWEETLIVRDPSLDFKGRQHLLDDPGVRHYHPLRSGNYPIIRR